MSFVLIQFLELGRKTELRQTTAGSRAGFQVMIQITVDRNGDRSMREITPNGRKDSKMTYGWIGNKICCEENTDAEKIVALQGLKDYWAKETLKERELHEKWYKKYHVDKYCTDIDYLKDEVQRLNRENTELRRTGGMNEAELDGMLVDMEKRRETIPFTRIGIIR